MHNFFFACSSRLQYFKSFRLQQLQPCACLCVCVWQEGVGDVLFHGEDASEHAGRLWDEGREGRSGAAQQAQRGESDLLQSAHVVENINKRSSPSPTTADILHLSTPKHAQGGFINRKIFFIHLFFFLNKSKSYGSTKYMATASSFYAPIFY